MSKQLKYFVFFIVAISVIACATKKEEVSGDEDQAEWQEMDDFHVVMAETFHPYKDSANLEPVRTRASELAKSAEKWATAPLPKKVDNDEMKEKLGQLKMETAALAEQVKSTDDKAIGDQLTKVHDLFHAIQEDWYGGEHHDH